MENGKSVSYKTATDLEMLPLEPATQHLAEQKGPKSVTKLEVLCIGTIVSLVFLTLGISSAVPITMVVTSSQALQRCPVDFRIPIWMLAAGAICLIRLTFGAICWVKPYKKKNSDLPLLVDVAIVTIFRVILFLWNVVGLIWIYEAGLKVQFDDDTTADYCNRSVFLFAYTIAVLGCLYLFSTLCLFFTFYSRLKRFVAVGYFF